MKSERLAELRRTHYGLRGDIALAPDEISELINEVERLTVENQSVEEGWQIAVASSGGWVDRIDRLTARLAAAEAVAAAMDGAMFAFVDRHKLVNSRILVWRALVEKEEK